MIGKKSRLFGAILLVSGTTIGAGMLALPVTTGLSGFIPSMILIVAIWLFMMLTAFYLLEVNLRLKGESNLILMMHKTLGKPGEVVSWITYLLLLYSLSASYLLGCSQILSDLMCAIFPMCLPDSGWAFAVFVLFGIFLFFGTEVVDYFNRILMLLLALSFIGVIVLGLPHIQGELLAFMRWPSLLAATPVIATSFGYHIIIPTLTTYLDHDVKALKKVIFIGSVIPVGIYLLWQLVAMGVIPVSGTQSLQEAESQGLPATVFLQQILQNRWVTIFARGLGFFAIVTSLLGVSLSLTDFLADGLKIQKQGWGKVFLILLAFIPPLVFAIFYPHGFILALRFAGFFVIILLALLPALMAYFERYIKEGKEDYLTTEFTVFGGKGLIVATIIVSAILLVIEGVA